MIKEPKAYKTACAYAILALLFWVWNADASPNHRGWLSIDMDTEPTDNSLPWVKLVAYDSDSIVLGSEYAVLYRGFEACAVVNVEWQCPVAASGGDFETVAFHVGLGSTQQFRMFLTELAVGTMTRVCVRGPNNLEACSDLYKVIEAPTVPSLPSMSISNPWVQLLGHRFVLGEYNAFAFGGFESRTGHGELNMVNVYAIMISQVGDAKVLFEGAFPTDAQAVPIYLPHVNLEYDDEIKNNLVFVSVEVRDRTGLKAVSIIPVAV